jgi:putative ABC transport system permease protein
MIVNEAFVQRFSRGRSALGITFDESISPRVKDRTVIGVVGNVVYGSLRDPAPPTVYLPLQQATGDMPPGATMVISARAKADAASLAPGVGAALRTIDRDLTFSFSLLADRVGGSIARERVQAILSALFGGVALLLAGLGLYGVTSYLVSRRQNEFGIRTALGARRGDVIWLAWHQSLIVTVIGIACGVVGAAAAGRFMSAMLFDLSPLDPATLIAASLIFVVVAAAASYMPARRATSVDPAVALREL